MPHIEKEKNRIIYSYFKGDNGEIVILNDKKPDKKKYLPLDKIEKKMVDKKIFVKIVMLSKEEIF